ncbi:hypothetical protein ASPWEDRAFT_49803 [Aspergillus wentii DTO 134E9]|uniref:Peptidase A1 domain-containing protein n=1 Tax=Aspergillus wentii DTO 134E9 TaxID=1073089 RepID=A0A1L9RYH6_ASPWE|nr:uncharacterized protein ASPWEDRAFT_49803 [Aspergillus wentii DTO 134E9]OJJ39962.1 hypothetical protein ASPWEDRAFT_49803 [Aspergillus wentii DTO 134E9]
MPSLLHPLCWLPALLGSAHAASPLNVLWSTKEYGPDGPWSAVSTTIGDKYSVDLYPGDIGSSNVMQSQLCENTTLSSTCYAERAGTVNISAIDYPISWKNPSNWHSCSFSTDGGCRFSDFSTVMSFGSSVPNVSMSAIWEAYETYPGGAQYQPQVGTLSLGGPYPFYPTNGGTNIINWYLYNDSSIPSYSYGLHIGSVEPSVTRSLLLGGYDQNRVLGEVSAQSVVLNAANSGALQIGLEDIGLGVASGGSPFNFTSKEGLFVQSDGVARRSSVTADPTKPYLYLPKNSCDAIAAELPVSFNESLGLYFWNTSSSQYNDIVSSPTYLSFTFDKDSANNKNFTIKVPFQLLNLTLQEPLVSQNTSYFPCFPYDEDNANPILGRAFLQAAFVGANFFQGTDNQGTWFLAQAPGPSLPATAVTTINPSDKTIQGSSSSWEETWDGYWTPLSDSGSSKKSGGLSTGGKVGVGVGVGIAGAIIIAAVAAWAIVRRRRNNAPQQLAADPVRPAELSEAYKPVDKPPVEVPAQEHMRYELD